MKTIQVIKFALVVLFITNCSSSDSIEPPVPKPVAFDDLYTTVQNREIVISDILRNDENVQGTSLELNTINTKGGVVNVNGIITFTPENNFIGKDSFSYTICETVQNNCSTATVFIDVEKGNVSIAVEDSYITIANKTLTIDDLTSNDVLESNVTISSVDKIANTEGDVTLDNEIVMYIPKTDFVGEDIFTYTICDDNGNCSSAPVRITVEDGINAIDDNYNASNTMALTISDLLDNDVVIAGTTILELDTNTIQGSAILQADGSVVYTPSSNFIGEDTFTYTICDNDTQNQTCATANVTINVVAGINFNIPIALQNYYNDVLFVEDVTIMFDEIESLTQTKHTTILTYGQRHNFLYDADEDLSNTANVVLMYTGESRDEREWTSGSNSHTPQTFNTEHVYPQSLLAERDEGEAFSDLHHLRACDAAVNSSRSNFRFVDSSGSNALINENSWYPGDEWKGDVARMILYLNIRYGETFTKVGSIELFLKWNREDPVSDFEVQRNTVIFGAQGNRNPFIDNPFIATLIWGGDAAENKW
ncbi:Ig-like domain-containing protein [Hyunsoonleella sp. 2307UL5-6]|uniref:Ig-like domain-containing protein n=1 Tax=Hyunsoonleella sp. 2307UL5-6 TaxID=3384768 RepID=UPI0039BD4726